MPFRVRRNFLILSLSGVLLVLSLSVIWYAHFAKSLLIAQETQSNASMTRILARLIWPEFSGFIIEGRLGTAEEMQNIPDVARLDRLMADFVDGSRILKIKIYNLQGFAIYSSERAQIGQNKADNPGVQGAIKGEVNSVLTFRHKFHAFEQAVADRNLLSTYIPLYSPENGEITGVFELYSDVSDMVRQIDGSQRIITITGIFGFGFVIGWMYWLVRRDERIIHAQYQELTDAKQTIEHLAYHDSLTELPNRNSFTEAMTAATAPGRAGQDGFALLFIDLDGFKEVNDRFGHAAGDYVLSETARRLCTAVRKTDRVFRVGGDEFTAMLSGITSEEIATRLAEKLIEVVGKPIDHNRHQLKVTASIGIGLYPTHGDNAEALLDLSDKAMYQAKQAGSNCYRMGSSRHIEAVNG